jgi:hypothetical protein
MSFSQPTGEEHVYSYRSFAKNFEYDKVDYARVAFKAEQYRADDSVDGTEDGLSEC